MNTPFLCNHFYQRFMAEQKYLVIVDAKDIELLKAAIEELNEKVDQLLNDRLENADTYLTSEEASKLLKYTLRPIREHFRIPACLHLNNVRLDTFNNLDASSLVRYVSAFSSLSLSS